MALPGWSLFAFALAGFLVGFADGSGSMWRERRGGAGSAFFCRDWRWCMGRQPVGKTYDTDGILYRRVLSTWSFVAITGLGIVEHLISCGETTDDP